MGLMPKTFPLFKHNFFGRHYGHVDANSSNLRVIKTKNYDGLFSGNFFQIRWFTPTNEVNLCGHATLATAAVLYNELGTL